MAPPPGPSDPRVTPLISLLAGGTAGGIEATLTYPFEFAKTRVQLRQEKGLASPRNPFAVINQVLKSEGVRALYLGCTTLVLGTIAKDAIRFVSFDAIKRSFESSSSSSPGSSGGSLSPLRSLGAGMAAGVVASTFAVTPTERVKTALIDDARAHPNLSKRQFRGPWHCTTSLLASHGLRGLYRGYLSTTLKQAGTTSVRMGTYNILKDLGRAYEVKQNTAMSFANGAVAGIVTTYATQPVDCVKTRAQSVAGEGMGEATRGIWKEEGWRGFWRGSTMRLGRTVFAGGILFTAYERVVEVLVPVMGREVDEDGRML